MNRGTFIGSLIAGAIGFLKGKEILKTDTPGVGHEQFKLTFKDKWWKAKYPLTEKEAFHPNQVSIVRDTWKIPNNVFIHTGNNDRGNCLFVERNSHYMIRRYSHNEPIKIQKGDEITFHMNPHVWDESYVEIKRKVDLVWNENRTIVTIKDCEA